MLGNTLDYDILLEAGNMSCSNSVPRIPLPFLPPTPCSLPSILLTFLLFTSSLILAVSCGCTWWWDSLWYVHCLHGNVRSDPLHGLSLPFSFSHSPLSTPLIFLLFSVLNPPPPPFRITPASQMTFDLCLLGAGLLHLAWEPPALSIYLRGFHADENWTLHS